MLYVEAAEVADLPRQYYRMAVFTSPIASPLYPTIFLRKGAEAPYSHSDALGVSRRSSGMIDGEKNDAAPLGVDDLHLAINLSEIAKRLTSVRLTRRARCGFGSSGSIHA